MLICGMLINCPKCGFSQPKDKYCASCGIDMDTFQPAKPSLMKQLWVSPVFLIGLTLGVVMLSVVFIRQKQREEIADRAELLRSGPVIVETAASSPDSAAAGVSVAEEPSSLADEEPLPESGAIAAASTDAPAPAPMTTVARNVVSEKAATEDSKAEASKVAAVPTAKINVTATYAEVNKQLLTQIEEDAQATGQFTDFGEFKAGALPDVRGHLRGVRVLQRVSKTFDSKALRQQWFVGARSGEDDVGLTTLVSVEPGTDGKLKGEIEILRSLPEGAEPNVSLVKKSYPISTFELGPRTGWIVHLSDLPRKIDGVITADFAGDTFLRLFRTASFMSGETEFTLFLEFDSPNP